ncbi:hypothetical protein ABPG72_014720 [Tetrahymena utriculariae]
MKAKTLLDNPENEVQKVYLVLGPSGAGKSSFVQYLTNDSKAEIGHGENSHTKECRVFFQNEKKFIDSPCINDIQENKYQILLNIVIYLKENNFKLENLFIIYVSNKPIKKNLRLLQEFAYNYFLYDLVGEQITLQDVEKLVKEYFQSTSLLNWEETGFQFQQDPQTELNMCQNLHIFVQTHYDKINKRKLKELNKYETEFLREQIWSNIREMHDQMNGYKEYISDQVNHLFCKIEKIISIQKELYKLVNKYFLSTCLLNWQETGFHHIQDSYTGKRIEIFKNKDKALDYIQYVYNLHIIVQTCYDKNNQQILKSFNNYQTEFLRQQIWSNKKELHNQMIAYKEYISNQELHLFNKIKKIFSLWQEVNEWKQGNQIQHILLIGESQVGKSSLIEQLKKISGLRGSGFQSETSFCQIYLVEHNKVKTSVLIRLDLEEQKLIKIHTII